MPEALAAQIKRDAAPVLMTLQSVEQLQPNPSVPQLKAALNAVDELQTAARRLTQTLARGLNRVTLDAINKLRSAPLAAEDRLPELSAAVNKLRDELTKMLEHPDAEKPLEPLLDEFDGTWRTVLLAQVPNIGEEDAELVEKRVEGEKLWCRGARSDPRRQSGRRGRGAGGFAR